MSSLHKGPADAGSASSTCILRPQEGATDSSRPRGGRAWPEGGKRGEVTRGSDSPRPSSHLAPPPQRDCSEERSPPPHAPAPAAVWAPDPCRDAAEPVRPGLATAAGGLSDAVKVPARGGVQRAQPELRVPGGVAPRSGHRSGGDVCFRVTLLLAADRAVTPREDDSRFRRFFPSSVSLPLRTLTVFSSLLDIV